MKYLLISLTVLIGCNNVSQTKTTNNSEELITLDDRFTSKKIMKFKDSYINIYMITDKSTGKEAFIANKLSHELVNIKFQ